MTDDDDHRTLSRLGDQALTKIIGYTFHDELKHFAEADDQTERDEHIYLSIRRVAVETQWITPEHLALEEDDYGVKLPPIRTAPVPEAEQSITALNARDTTEQGKPINAVQTDVQTYRVLIEDRTFYQAFITAPSEMAAKQIAEDKLNDAGSEGFDPHERFDIASDGSGFEVVEVTPVTEHSRFADLIATGEMTDRRQAQSSATDKPAKEATKIMQGIKTKNDVGIAD